MALRKYLDWRGWLEGLYLSWIKTVSTTATTYFVTNGAEGIGLIQVGITWDQALYQLAILTGYELFSYLKNKPKPELVTETIDTSFTPKP